MCVRRFACQRINLTPSILIVTCVTRCFKMHALFETCNIDTEGERGTLPDIHAAWYYIESVQLCKFNTYVSAGFGKRYLLLQIVLKWLNGGGWKEEMRKTNSSNYRCTITHTNREGEGGRGGLCPGKCNAQSRDGRTVDGQLEVCLKPIWWLSQGYQWFKRIIEDNTNLYQYTVVVTGGCRAFWTFDSVQPASCFLSVINLN